MPSLEIFPYHKQMDYGMVDEDTLNQYILPNKDVHQPWQHFQNERNEANRFTIFTVE